MRSWGWIPHDKYSVLKGRDQSPLRLYRVRTQQEDVSLKTRKTVLIRQSICQCLDLGLPSLLNHERCLFKSSVVLCYNSLNRLKQMFYPSLLFFKLKLSQIWHLKPMFMPHQYLGIFFFSDSRCSKFTLSLSAPNLAPTVFPNIAGSVEQYLENKIKVTRCVHYY